MQFAAIGKAKNIYRKYKPGTVILYEAEALPGSDRVMSEEEYMERVSSLCGIRLPDPDAEKQMRFYYSLQAPVWQAVGWLKEYLAIPSSP
jgi:hypothetical protein